MREDPDTPFPDKHRWRFFCSGPAELGSSITLDPDESHLATVLRLKPGQTIEVTDGNGFLAEAKLVDLQRRKTTIQMTSTEYVPRRCGGTAVFVGKARTSALEEALESASQFGAERFVIFSSEKSQNRQQLKIERLNKIARESARISKNVYFTDVDLLCDRPGLLPLLEQFDQDINRHETMNMHMRIVVCDESPLHDHTSTHPHLLDRLLHAGIQQTRPVQNALIVGPEGGLTANERQEILRWSTHRHADLHFVSLGEFILTVPNAVRCATVLAEAARGTHRS